MGCLEFVMDFENLASVLPTDVPPELKAWRHEVMCKLIDAGVTNPDEIKQSVDTLYELVTSQSNLQNLKHPCLDTETLQVRLEGILHGKTFLDRLTNFVYLLEDEKRAQARIEKR